MHTAIPSPAISKPAPWNKGRLIGQKRPLKPKEVWAIRARLQLERRARDLALFNLAIDSKLRGCDLVRLMVEDVFAPVAEFESGPPSFRERPGGRFSSKSPSRPGPRSRNGYPKSTQGAGGIYSRADSGRSRISQLANMRASSTNGLRVPDSTARLTGRTRCAGRRQHRSTKRREICEQFSFCLDTRSWKAPSAISVLRSTML
jgi:hypothetical protein